MVEPSLGNCPHVTLALLRGVGSGELLPFSGYAWCTYCGALIRNPDAPKQSWPEVRRVEFYENGVGLLPNGVPVPGPIPWDCPHACRLDMHGPHLTGLWAWCPDCGSVWQSLSLPPLVPFSVQMQVPDANAAGVWIHPRSHGLPPRVTDAQGPPLYMAPD